MNVWQVGQVAYDSVPASVKPVIDVLAIVGWITALAGALTTIFGLVAAVASAAWGLIRLYETRTVQSWLKRRREKKHARD
jgi:hypothetical protein